MPLTVLHPSLHNPPHGVKIPAKDASCSVAGVCLAEAGSPELLLIGGWQEHCVLNWSRFQRLAGGEYGGQIPL